MRKSDKLTMSKTDSPMCNDLEQYEIVNFYGNSMPYECIDEFFIVIGKGQYRKDEILNRDVPIGFESWKEAQLFRQKLYLQVRQNEQKLKQIEEFVKEYEKDWNDAGVEDFFPVAKHLAKLQSILKGDAEN
jgi:hypothetical protein